MEEKKVWIFSVEARNGGEVLDYEGFWVCESRKAAVQAMRRKIAQVSRENNCFTGGGGAIGDGFNVEQTDWSFDCWSPNDANVYCRMVVEERPIVQERKGILSEDKECSPEIRDAINEGWELETLHRDWCNILYAIAAREDATDYLDDGELVGGGERESAYLHGSEILNNLCDEADLKVIASFLRLV